MKRLMLGIVLCVALAIGGFGCEEQMVTPAQLQSIAAQQEVLQQQVETMQATATQMTGDLEAAGIVDANAIAMVAKINEEADRIQVQIDNIAQALAGVPLTGDDAQDFIAQLQAANAATVAFNPYVIPVGTGLSILSIVLGWLAKRKTTEAEVATLKYAAHKAGVERTMKEVSASPDSKVVEIESTLYNNIGEARASLGV